MPRALAALVAALACACATAAAAQDRLPPAVLRALHAAGVAPDAVAAVALPLGRRAKPWLHRAHVPMQPASTMKLVTSIVALDRLGPDLRGSTELRSAAPLQGDALRGDLVLKGGADPDLGVPQFWAMLMELRQQGVREIAGDLVVDRSLFRPARPDIGAPPFDDGPEFAYNVIPDALELAGNLLAVDLVATGDALRADALPALPGLEIASRMSLDSRPCGDWDEEWQPPRLRHEGERTVVELRGAFPAGCTRRAELQLIDRLELAERLFWTLWTGLGGSWSGHAREVAESAPAPAGSRLLVRRQSRPWGEVLRQVNKESDNALARLLYLQLGAASPRDDGLAPTAELAAREVRRWLAEHAIDDRGLVLDNGSGLSRSERITPWQLASMLEAAHAGPHAADLEMSLPVAGIDGTLRQRLTHSPATGWARLKSGTLRNVVALAGYLRDAHGRPWAVAMMINDEHAAQARPALDALVDAFTRAGAEGTQTRSRSGAR